MKVHTIEQRSDEWHAVRSSKFTASAFYDLMMRKSTLGYKKAVARVVYGRLNGRCPDEDFQSADMQNGIDLEPMGLEAYSNDYPGEILDVGFVEMSEWIGGSPDGLIKIGDGIPGMVELKCPRWNTHIEYFKLKEGQCPQKYFWQIHGLMWITGLKWCDFVSYHPELPLVVRRIERDDVSIANLATRLKEAQIEAESILESLKSGK